jgi:hypothetical protein
LIKEVLFSGENIEYLAELQEGLILKVKEKNRGQTLNKGDKVFVNWRLQDNILISE